MARTAQSRAIIHNLLLKATRGVTIAVVSSREKLQVVLDALISECSSIAAEQAMIGKRPVKAS